MNPLDVEGKVLQQIRKDREQIVFTDTLGLADDFKLRYLVYGVDVVDAFGALQVTLVHGVHADKAGLATLGWGLRRSPMLDCASRVLLNVNRFRVQVVERLRLYRCEVEMPASRREAEIFLLAKQPIGSLIELLGGRPA